MKRNFDKSFEKVVFSSGDGGTSLILRQLDLLNCAVVRTRNCVVAVSRLSFLSCGWCSGSECAEESNHFQILLKLKNNYFRTVRGVSRFLLFRTAPLHLSTHATLLKLSGASRQQWERLNGERCENKVKRRM